MKNQQIAWLNVAFADHARVSNRPEPILELIRRAWQGIDQAMRPIIGRGGIEALFHRALEMTVEAHPWLADGLTSKPNKVNLEVSFPDLDPLIQLLAKQEASHFAAASDTLLVNFYNLLTNLIGLSLTDRLLRPMLDPLLNGTVAKDI